MEMESDFRAVTPVAPAAGWIGGKKQLARRLCEIIDGVPHRVYAEPFMGMGGVFFRRRRAARVEAINDADRDVAIFFRVLQRHYQALMDMLKWQVTSRAEFERAARLIYLQKLAFGGKVRGRTFGIDTHGPARFDITKLGSVLEAIHERLAGVTIDCLDWREFIARWDRPETLFFVDPPYYGTEGVYQARFERADHEALASLLMGIKGRVVLTMSDSAETRAIYGGIGEIEAVGVTYTAAGRRGGKRAGEIIVTRR